MGDFVVIQNEFNFELDNEKQVQEKWFCLFWKYVKRGSYQKFIADLKGKKTSAEIDEINLLIRNVYIDLARKNFSSLGNIEICPDNSTVTIEKEVILKRIQPSFNRGDNCIKNIFQKELILFFSDYL